MLLEKQSGRKYFRQLYSQEIDNIHAIQNNTAYKCATTMEFTAKYRKYGFDNVNKSGYTKPIGLAQPVVTNVVGHLASSVPAGLRFKSP
jgi:hypothetical protein